MNTYAITTGFLVVTFSITASMNNQYVTRIRDRIELNLPSGSAVNIGDTLRVFDGMGGGFKITQQLNQVINCNKMNLSGAWVPKSISTDWSDLAASADGTFLYAAPASGQLYTSWDAGATWVARDSTRTWKSVSCSSNGMYAVATVNNGYLYITSNYGLSWTQRDSVRYWKGSAVSADGRKMYVCASNYATSLTGCVYRSTDYGVTWLASNVARYYNYVCYVRRRKDCYGCL